MSDSPTKNLKRATNCPSGHAAGGAETGWDVQPQPTVLTVTLTSAAPSRSTGLPAGTILLKSYIIPELGLVPTAGTVTLVAGATTHISAVAATAIAETDLTPVQLATDTIVTATAASLSGSSAVRVGFEVILPNTRD